MTTVHTNELVADYLRRLERAAAPLPRSRRAELVAEIREHIDDALLEAGAADEVVVRNVLERLGPPGGDRRCCRPPARSARAGRLELAALIALAMPFVGWLVGVVLVSASRAWTRRDKAVAIGLVLLPAVVLALGFVAVSRRRLGGHPGRSDVGDEQRQRLEQPRAARAGGHRRHLLRGAAVGACISAPACGGPRSPQGWRQPDAASAVAKRSCAILAQ